MTGRPPELQAMLDANPIEDVIGRYVALRKDGDLYRGLCPFHADAKTPSLTVYPNHNNPHYHCYGCPAHGDVIDFVRRVEHVGFVDALAIIAGNAPVRLGEDTTRDSSPGPALRKVGEHSYVIVDEPGNKIEHVRIQFVDEDGAPHKRFVWRRNGRPGLDGLKAEDLPLYACHLLAGLAGDSDVVVTEGEKACEALWRRGTPAVGTVTGANGTPSQKSLAPVAAREGRVLLWPDNDNAGRDHMDRIASALTAMGKPCFVVHWPDAPEKGDAADYTGNVVGLLSAARPWEQFTAPPTSANVAVAPSLPDPDRLSDTTNAEYLAARYGDRLRYDHMRGRWLAWGTHYFVEDPDGEVWRLSKEVARELYTRAVDVPDLKSRGRLSKFAIDSEQRGRREAMVSLARFEYPIADKGEDWDAKHLLLACPNGVVDLETGILRPGSPEDRLTRHTGVQYEPDARCPRWLRFLDEVFSGDLELVDWVQRFIGYSASGLTVEQCMALLEGGGSNGKGTLLRALGHCLGSYYYNAPFATFEMSSRPSIPNDLAALERRRLVASSETNEGVRLNEARIKAITGEDDVTARYLHREFFTFRPQLKLWLAVNHLPVVQDHTFGFWRRVRVIPFKRTFPLDQTLDAQLRLEAPGILAWIVRGCMEYLQRGLDPAPSAVLVSTEEYKQDSDDVASFLSERCITDTSNASALGGDLYKAYLRWCEAEGIKKDGRLTSTMFGKRMHERFRREKTREGKRYYGVGLCDGFVTGFEAKEGFGDV